MRREKALRRAWPLCTSCLLLFVMCMFICIVICCTSCFFAIAVGGGYVMNGIVTCGVWLRVVLS